MNLFGIKVIEPSLSDKSPISSDEPCGWREQNMDLNPIFRIHQPTDWSSFGRRISQYV